MSRPIEDLPLFVREFAKDTVDVLQETAERVRKRMAVPGKPVVYPIQWDSPKQRKAFFASDGFGRGIPYQRIQQYELGWKANRHPFGVALYNMSPAGAVGGLPSGWQSRIHRGRYPHLLTVLFEELAKIPSEISNKFSVRSGK